MALLMEKHLMSALMEKHMKEIEKQAYGKVIDLLMEDKVDFRAVCLMLAKEAPEVFIALHESVNPNPKDELREEMIRFIKHNPGKKVDAIKHYRIRTGEALKESKDYVDQLMDELAGPEKLTTSAGDLIAEHFRKVYMPDDFVTSKDTPRFVGDGSVF